MNRLSVPFRGPEVASMVPEGQRADPATSTVSGFETTAGDAVEELSMAPELLVMNSDARADIIPEVPKSSSSTRRTNLWPLPPGTTTLVVRNISCRNSKEHLMKEWPPDGSYDLLFLPMTFEGRSSGCAFINFVSPKAALDFQLRAHGTYPQHAKRPNPSYFDIRAAKVQGFHATLARLKPSRSPNQLVAIFKGKEQLSPEQVLVELDKLRHGHGEENRRTSKDGGLPLAEVQTTELPSRPHGTRSLYTLIDQEMDQREHAQLQGLAFPSPSTARLTDRWATMDGRSRWHPAEPFFDHFVPAVGVGLAQDTEWGPWFSL